MKVVHAFLALLIVLIMAVSTVSAYPEAEIETGAENLSVCPCSTLTPGDIEASVKNLDESEAVYDLELVLPDEEKWSGFIVPNVSLGGGKTAAVSVFVTPSCSVKPGKYSIGIRASSAVSGMVSSASFEVEVAKCRWVSIGTHDYELCQGKEAIAGVNFTNEGLETEIVRVSTNRDWAVFPVDEFEIESGASGVLDLVLTPAVDMEGGDEVIVTLETESYVENKGSITVDVRKCYATEFSVVPEHQEVCPCKKAGLVVEINNTGLFDDNYTVVYGGQTDEVMIPPNGSAKIFLSVDVACDKEDGNYSLGIGIDSRDPRAPLGTDVTVGVLPLDEYYSVGLLSYEGTEGQVLGVGESSTYTLLVGNKGMFPQVYDMVLEAPEWVHLSDSSVELGPLEAAEVYMYVAPGYDTSPGNYTMRVSAFAENEKETVEIKVSVLSEFGAAEEEDIQENITMNMSIPTGEVISEVEGSERPWSQIIMITILAIGVVFVLILRFVIMMK